MESQAKKITVKTTVKTSVEEVWECWTLPYHISKWNYASGEWHCPSVANDLVQGGKFSWRMEAKDKSIGFNYSGVYERVEKFKTIRKKLDDGRTVNISFSENNGKTEITESFEPDVNSTNLQLQGWQAILNNFQKYVESVA